MCQAASHPAEQLICDRFARSGKPRCKNLLSACLTDQDCLAPDTHIRNIRDVHGELVHADSPHNRRVAAVYEHAALPARELSRIAVRIAHRQYGKLCPPLRDKGSAVPDALARLHAAQQNDSGL